MVARYKHKAAAATVVKCVTFLKFMKLVKNYYIYGVSVPFFLFSVLPTLKEATYARTTGRGGRHVFQPSC